MLTQEQKDKLSEFTNHPKFGKLLQNAILIWDLPKVNPTYSRFGITIEDSVWKVKSLGKSCCLLGASLVGKESVDSEINSMWTITKAAKDSYSILENEARDLIQGFDCFRKIPSNESEAFIFGNTIGKILFI